MRMDEIYKSFPTLSSMFGYYPALEEPFRNGRTLTDEDIRYLYGFIDGLYAARGLAPDYYCCCIDELQRYEEVTK